MQQTVFNKSHEFLAAPAGLYRVTFDPSENAEGVTTAAMYIDQGGIRWLAPINWHRPVKMENHSHQIEKMELIPVGDGALPQPKEDPLGTQELASNQMFAHLVEMMAEIPGVTLSAKHAFDPEEGYFVDLTFTKEEKTPGYMDGMMNASTRSVTVEAYVGTKHTRTKMVESVKSMLIRALQEIGVKSFATIRGRYLTPLE